MDRWTACAAFLLIAAPVLVHAQEETTTEEKSARTFSPEVEKKFADLIEKNGEAKTKDESAQLKKEITALVKVTGLDEAGQKALEAPAAAAVETSVKDWVAKIARIYRSQWDLDANPEMIDGFLAQASNLARVGFSVDYLKAVEQPAWKDALDRVLDAKQAAAWKADVDERRRKFDEETKGVISAAKERVREQNQQVLSGTVSVMALAIGLDEERRKKLEKIADEAADKSADSVKEKARRMLLGYDEAQLKQALKGRMPYFAPDAKDAPDKQEIWKNGLKQLLSTEETQLWEATLQKRSERREQVLAGIFVWAMDESMALTAKQREQLQPLALECIRAKKELFPDRGVNYSYNNTTIQQFHRAAAAAKEDDLKKILDAKQLDRWKAVTASFTGGRQAATVRRVVNASTANMGAKPAQFEPEELEAALSDYSYRTASRDQKRMLNDTFLQVEDVVRIAGLDGKAVQRLQTAARGTMERESETWKSGMASNIRAQMQNATPEDFHQRAEEVGFSNYAGRRKRGGSNEGADGIWEKTIAAELTEAQQAAWKAEIDIRNAYERKSGVAAVMGELDRICILTEEQWGKFDALLVERVRDYGPDIEQMFSHQQTSWFLQSYYMLTIVAGIPEKELRQILTDAQWKQLSASNQFTNGQRYWENIESNRKQRMEREKQKKTDK